MCVLNRTFAIKQMTRWASAASWRDLTDAMYNPKKSPFVAHEAGVAGHSAHREALVPDELLSKDLLGR
jgi:hypothetical protein